jgi:hypothetical protein
MRGTRSLSVLLGAFSLAVAAWAAPGPAFAGALPPGTTAGPAVTTPACEMKDLALSELASETKGDEGVYVVENRGAAACRITGGVSIRLLDAQGNEVPLGFAPRTMMAMLLTLAPGAKASFTVKYVTIPAKSCPLASRIAAYFPGQTTPLTAQANIEACTGSVVLVSNLRAGLPPPSRLPIL